MIRKIIIKILIFYNFITYIFMYFSIILINTYKVLILHISDMKEKSKKKH